MVSVAARCEQVHVILICRIVHDEDRLDALVAAGVETGMQFLSVREIPQCGRPSGIHGHQNRAMLPQRERNIVVDAVALSFRKVVEDGSAALIPG